MKVVFTALALGAAAFAAGLTWKDAHVRLRAPGQPADQVVLDHRDSAYTSMTWVASPSENYLQLRFFDKVEGGWCLHPSWAELRKQAAGDPRLAHLVPAGEPAASAPGGPRWPTTLPLPDPGTLPNSAYVRFFPVGVLVNERLMRAAGGDPQRAAPRVMIVGLGSGVGIGVLAHHFPQASITVVDIDQKVIDAVLDHVPLMKWLTTQRTADGSPRLRLVAQDARQFVRFDQRGDGRPWDLVVLDAYTAGSTIPSHLMTREFFAQVAATLGDDGVLLANIIGSYEGSRRQVLGGAIRSMRAGGLAQVVNIPVLRDEPAGDFDAQNDRNNIVIASRAPLDSHASPAAWARLTAFIPFPELALGSAVTRHYLLARREGGLSASVPADAIEAADPGLSARLRANPPANPKAPQFTTLAMSDDPQVIEAARKAALAWAASAGRGLVDGGEPLGWRDPAQRVLRSETDWVKAAREVVRVSLAAARDAATHGGEALVGPPDGPARDGAMATWRIADAPLFTDQRPNADILNH